MHHHTQLPSGYAACTWHSDMIAELIQSALLWNSPDAHFQQV
jgi:hypothetical protein